MAEKQGYFVPSPREVRADGVPPGGHLTVGDVRLSPTPPQLQEPPPPSTRKPPRIGEISDGSRRGECGDSRKA
jgi:hypothetical protein